MHIGVSVVERQGQIRGYQRNKINRKSPPRLLAAGEHCTRREVMRLMVDLVFIEDEETLTKKGSSARLTTPRRDGWHALSR